ncbi:Uncharacterized protein TPAR_06297 [Tolypocladium paradoxum]|uniref:Uncharacterized protein n=1 Tax=Tolypocladium paradoxum TaxID=94208 RepID=A0A2S4KTM1_9HYPO|nr:Uncharacterized protein TPAR_06297 [Tolypocladium paradoxum]
MQHPRGRGRPNVQAYKLAIAPLQQTADNSDLNAGYAGYAFWFRDFKTSFIGNATSGYNHGIWTIGKDQNEADAAFAAFAAFAPVRRALSKFNDRLYIRESPAKYTDYRLFYDAESASTIPSATPILTSRMIDREAVQDYGRVRDTVEVISGKPEDYAANVVLLVSGGQVFKDAADTTRA